MKKIFTLITGLFLTVALMAADRNPELYIRNSKNFKVVIDGRSYDRNSTFLKINNLSRGSHRIDVFESKKGLFGQREKLLNSSTFNMDNEDLRMDIDQSGQIAISRQPNRYNNGRNNEMGSDDPRRVVRNSRNGKHNTGNNRNGDKHNTGNNRNGDKHNRKIDRDEDRDDDRYEDREDDRYEDRDDDRYGGKKDKKVKKNKDWKDKKNDDRSSDRRYDDRKRF